MRLAPSEASEAAGGFALYERLEGFADYGRLFFQAGVFLRFRNQFIVERKGRPREATCYFMEDSID